MTTAMTDNQPTTEPDEPIPRCGREPGGVRCFRPLHREDDRLRCSRHGLTAPDDVVMGPPIDPAKGGRPATPADQRPVRYGADVPAEADAVIRARAQRENITPTAALLRYLTEGMDRDLRAARKNRRSG